MDRTKKSGGNFFLGLIFFVLAAAMGVMLLIATLVVWLSALTGSLIAATLIIGGFCFLLAGVICWRCALRSHAFRSRSTRSTTWPTQPRRPTDGSRTKSTCSCSYSTFCAHDASKTDFASRRSPFFCARPRPHPARRHAAAPRPSAASRLPRVRVRTPPLRIPVHRTATGPPPPTTPRRRKPQARHGLRERKQERRSQRKPPSEKTEAGTR